MRNTWKGLVIGGLTGAGAGLVLDLLNRGARLVSLTGQKAADMAPGAAERVKSAVAGGVARVQEAEIGDNLRDHTKEIAHRLNESEQAGQAREALGQAKRKGRQAAHTVQDSAPLRSLG